MKETLLAAKEAVLSRMKHPILGTFLLSFVLFNWRAFAILFLSKSRIEERLFYIEANYSDRCHYLYWPLMVTAAFVLILPPAMVVIDGFWTLIQRCKTIALAWVDLRGITTAKRLAEEQFRKDVEDAERDLHLYKVRSIKSQVEHNLKAQEQSKGASDMSALVQQLSGSLSALQTSILDAKKRSDGVVGTPSAKEGVSASK